MRRILAFLSATLLLAASLPATASAASPHEAVIVVFRDDVGNAGRLTAQLAREHRFSATYVYEHAIKGFAASVPATALAGLRRNPNVVSVEADATAYMTDTPQEGATWGLDRIDQRDLPLDTVYTYAGSGDGVTAYVIDSGIVSGHAEFGGRASLGRDFVGTNGGEDCNGHGTHVAGTIGGATYGVAKDARLVSVRVFDCTGGASWSRIIAAVDWVTANAQKPAVVNMSIGGSASSLADQAIRTSIASGIAYVIAAGNNGANACNYSPARVAEAMTISATDKTDTRASWGNYGSCVDWFAPGVSVVSAGISSTTATATKSGTSMATPHAAGVAALYLEANAGASPAEVRDALYAATTRGVVRSSSSANNHLLYNLRPYPPSVSIAGPTTGSAVAATVAIEVSATDAEDDVAGTPLSVTVSIDSAETQAATLNDAGRYEVAWDVSGLTEGSSHTIDATATDSAGSSGTATQVTVTVDNVDDAPTVEILSPAPDGTVSGTITAVVAADDDRDAAGALVVEVAVDGTYDFATYNDLTGYYEYSWDTGPLENGSVHSLAARATDASLLVTDSAPVAVTVDNSVPPTIAVTVTGSATSSGPTWTAIATIHVSDASGPLDSVVVTGYWGTSTARPSCTTGSTGVDGACSITMSGIAKRTGSVVFTLASVQHPAWDGSSQNVRIHKQ